MDPTLTPILGLSGSLRRDSVNSAALRAAAKVARDAGARMLVDDLIRDLPPFDPDEEQDLALAVRRFRMRSAGAAGVLVAVPEYAFGIPGAFKNALDWTVASGSLYRKPVAVLSLAPKGRGKHVQRALELVFEALGADIVSHRVPVTEADRDREGNITSPRVVGELRAVLADLVARARAVDSGLAEAGLRALRHNG